MELHSSSLDSGTSIDDTANYLLQCARQQPQLLRHDALQVTLGLPSGADRGEEGSTKWRSIHDKLMDLYLEYCANLKADSEAAVNSGQGAIGSKDEEGGEDEKPVALNAPTDLLCKLVEREKLNALVLKLLPGNEGYTVALKGQNGNPDSETIRLPYEEEEFLNFVDSEQLPPVLVELLQQCQENFFYSGCVVLEVKDFRRLSANVVPAEGSSWDSFSFTLDYVLLRPTNLNLVCGINGYIAASGPGDPNSRWTQEERDSLESQLLLATSEPLCLNPDPSLSLVLNKLHFERQKLSRPSLRKAMRRFGQVARNRRKMFSSFPAPQELALHDFIKQRGDLPKATPPVNLRISKSQAVDTWRRRSVRLDLPKSGVEMVEDLAKPLPFELPSTNAAPVTVEEFILETERQTGKVNYTRVVIQQRPTDHLYIGELYVDKDFEDGKLKGCSCKFPLGSKASVEKYIQQFTEIVTEEGRRPVKITHVVPGQAAKICSTTGLGMSGTSGSKGSRSGSRATATAAAAAANPSVSQANQSTNILSNVQASAPPVTLQMQPGAVLDIQKEVDGGGGVMTSMLGGGALQAKKSGTTHLKISLPGGGTATANVHLVTPPTSNPNNVSLVQSVNSDVASTNYQIISTEEDAGFSSSNNQTLTSVAGIQNLPPGTQLQFQHLSQVHNATFSNNIKRTNGVPITASRQNSVGGSSSTQVMTPLTNFSGANAPSAVTSIQSGNIFHNLTQLQQGSSNSVVGSISANPSISTNSTNVLTSPQIQSLQIQRPQLQQQQTFNRRSAAGFVRGSTTAPPQLRIHQQPSGDAGGNGGLIQIHPSHSQTGGANIIQIHQGQILKSVASSGNVTSQTGSGGLMQTNQTADLSSLQSRASCGTGTISPGSATATLIPGGGNASAAINLANLQQIQIQQSGNLTLPTQLQMSIGGVSGGITVPVSLAAALSQSVSANSSAGNVQQVVSTTSVPASIALALGSLAQTQSLSAPVMTTGTKIISGGTSGPVFVTSSALPSGNNMQHLGVAVSSSSVQQSQQQPQALVMATAGPFLQINASGSSAGVKGTLNTSSGQIRNNQIPLLQTMGLQQGIQQQQNLLVNNQKSSVALQQGQHDQRTVQNQTANIQIQNPNSTSGISKFRII